MSSTEEGTQPMAAATKSPEPVVKPVVPAPDHPANDKDNGGSFYCHFYAFFFILASNFWIFSCEIFSEVDALLNFEIIMLMFHFFYTFHAILFCMYQMLM